NWKYVFKSRSGGVAGGVSLDNVVLQANTYGAGSATYLSSISTSQTFYVSEINPATGCESFPRTPVVANVTFGDVVTATASSTSFCLGTSFTLGATQTGTSGNAYNYTWAAAGTGSGLPFGANSQNPGTVTPSAAGTYTYTVNASDGLCNAVPSSITVT